MQFPRLTTRAMISKTAFTVALVCILFSTAPHSAFAQGTSTTYTPTPIVIPTDAKLNANLKNYTYSSFGLNLPQGTTIQKNSCNQYNTSQYTYTKCAASDGNTLLFKDPTALAAVPTQTQYQVVNSSGQILYDSNNDSGGIGNVQYNAPCDPAKGTCTSTASSTIANSNLQAAGQTITKALDSFDSVFKCMANPIGCIAYLILQVAQFILWVAGGLFNWVVLRTVFQFSTLIGNSPGLLIAWGILRDVGNIVLLFGFIFMGIATILDIHNYTARKALPNLIIFAVLLNFSLFAAEAVIDTSNVFTSIMYNQASSQTCQNTSFEDCALNVGIAGQIIQQSGVASMFKAPLSQTFTLSNIILFIGLALFLTITAVVLFAGAIMLVIRAVVLTFIMALAPIGFAGMAIPPLQPLARLWWDKLISQAFFAPVYILLVLISLKIMAGLNTAANGQTFGIAEAILGGGVPGGSGGGSPVAAMGVFMIFALLIGFMIASLMVAKQMGVMGASFAANSASSLVYGGLTRVTNAGVGGSAFALRKIQQRTGFGGTAGKVAVNRLLRPLERANLDLRRTPGVAGVLGAAGITAGAKPAEHATFGEMKHEVQDIYEGKVGKELEAQYQKEKMLSDLEREAHENNNGGELSSTSKDFLNKLSTKELGELHGIKTASEAIAQNLTQDQYDALQKSDALTDDEKRNLKAARDARFDATQVLPPGAAAGTPTITRAERTLATMKPDQVAALPVSIIIKPEVLRGMTGAQLATIDPGKMADADRALVRTHISDARGRVAAGTATAKERGQITHFDTLVGGPTAPPGASANVAATRRWRGWI